MAPHKFVIADWYIQTIMLGIMLLCLFLGLFTSGATILLAMFLLMPFGAWQVISGVVNALYGSVWHMKYLGFVLAYFLIGGMGTVIVQEIQFRELAEFLEAIGVFILIVAPLVLGTSILYITYQNMTRARENAKKPSFDDMEDILDAAMVEG